MIPSRKVYCPQIRQLPIKLADPEFERPGKIDVLLGNEVFFELLGQDKQLINDLTVYETVFGYVVSGVAPEKSNTNKSYCGLVHKVEDLTTVLRSFWEVETVEEEQDSTE